MEYQLEGCDGETLEQLQAVYPTVVLVERFNSTDVNVDIPDGIVDNVLEWCEENDVEYTLH